MYLRVHSSVKELENPFMKIHLLAHEAIVGLVCSLRAGDPWRLEPCEVPTRHDARVSSGRLVHGNGVIREVILQTNKHQNKTNKTQVSLFFVNLGFFLAFETVTNIKHG